MRRQVKNNVKAQAAFEDMPLYQHSEGLIAPPGYRWCDASRLIEDLNEREIERQKSKRTKLEIDEDEA